MRKINRIYLLLVLTSLFIPHFLLGQPQKPIDSNLSDEEFNLLTRYYEQHKAQFSHLQTSTHSAPPYLNALLKEDSPYLQKHAFNPINWQTWSDNALSEATEHNKLIFLSVGFATCFWCQVMEQESFHEIEIAKYLNKHFIAIKVDREVHPDVDEFYSQALNVVKGSSGWPVTAVLTPNRAPIFMESYVDPQSLLRLLMRIQDTWQKSPDFFTASSQQILNRVAQRVAHSATITSTDNIPWADITEQLVSQLDVDEGGFSGQPKFPSEAMLLFALDTLKRSENPELKARIKRQLDNMASRGLYDHIHGGFHRYSSDGRWMLPHYEKMLYNQGLMLLVYRRAYDLFPEASYKQILREIITYVANTLYDSKSGLYSSVDAVYKGEEGGFYLYGSEQLKHIKTQMPDAAVARYYHQENRELARIIFQRPYSPEAVSIRQKLQTFKDSSALFIDKKNIAAWSALFIWGVAESYDILRDKRILRFAEELASQVEQSHMTSKQLYRIQYNGSTSIPATLEDFAMLARAYLALYERTFDSIWLDRAIQLVNQGVNKLHSNSNGFTFSSDNKLPVRLVNTADGELPNAQAMMLEVLNMLQKHEDAPRLQNLIHPLASMLANKVKEKPMAHLYSGKVLRDVQRHSTNSTQFFARGNGRIILAPQKDCSYSLTFRLKGGWHVNSNLPQAEDLIPTSVSLPANNVNEVFFPDTDIIHFGPSKREISVFENTFTVLISGVSHQARITLQACSTIEHVCLLPETVNFYLPVCPFGPR